MTLTLLVGNKLENFSKLKEVLKDNGHKIVDATSIPIAQNILTELSIDLLIVDEKVKGIEGLKFIKETVMQNPFINSAIVSELSHEDFHEVSEGYGILMQLTPTVSHEESFLLVEKVKKITTMTDQNRSKV